MLISAYFARNIKLSIVLVLCWIKHCIRSTLHHKTRSTQRRLMIFLRLPPHPLWLLLRILNWWMRKKNIWNVGTHLHKYVAKWQIWLNTTNIIRISLDYSWWESATLWQDIQISEDALNMIESRKNSISKHQRTEIRMIIKIMIHLGNKMTILRRRRKKMRIQIVRIRTKRVERATNTKTRKKLKRKS